MSSRAAAVLVVILLAGCGNPESPGSPSRVEHWGVTPRVPDWCISPHRGKVYLHSTSPEARTGTPDEWDNDTARRLFLHLEVDGTVALSYAEFNLFSDNAEKRAAATGALRDAFVSERKRMDERHREGAPPLVGLHFHVDRSCSWRDARDCLLAAVSAGVPTHRLRVTVRAPATEARHVLEVRLEKTNAGQEEKLAVRISRTKARTTIRVSPGGAWQFPRGDAFDDETFLAEANKQWAGIERALNSQSGAGPVSLSVDHDVRWAYVVKLLDLALTPASSGVLLREDGLRLTRAPE